jgi:hypothetical protein
MKESFTMLIHGDAGVGKSWLAASGPPPVLIIDLEGRARRLPYRKMYWDPVTETPPVYDGTWTHCVALTTKFVGLEKAYQWLQSGQHPFRTVVVDSLTFAQKRFIDDLKGSAQMQTQDWGEVLRSLETMVRDYCDLPLHQTNPVENVIFTVGTKSAEGRRVPLLQGALKDTAAYMYDAVGYLYLAPDTSGHESRNLLVQPSAGIVAKDGTNCLGGPVIPSPDLTQLVTLLADESDDQGAPVA